MKDRVLMIYPSSELPFLPPFEEFLRLIGFDAGMPGLVRDLAHQLEKVPPSDKTLRSAFAKPITRSTAERIQGILEAKISDSLNMEELKDQMRPWEELRLRSNGATWLPAIAGLRQQVLNGKFAESHAERFIHKRINAERLFLLKIKPVLLSKTRTKHDQETLESAMTDLLYENTLVDRDLIEKASKVNRSEPEASLIEQRLFQEIRIDFYYNLLATLSLDLLQRLQELDIESLDSQEFISKGLFGIIAPNISADGKIEYPFAQLLDRWRTVFSVSPTKPLTLRELSKAIPHPHDEKLSDLDPESVEYKDLLYVAMQTRKTRLREWRGGVAPQGDQLVAFVRNLLPEGADGYYPWLIAQISIVWGRLIDQEMEKSGELPCSFENRMLFRFQDVWERYEAQAASILAT